MSDRAGGGYIAAFGTQKKYKWKVAKGGSFAAGVPPAAAALPAPDYDVKLVASKLVRVPRNPASPSAAMAAPPEARQISDPGPHPLDQPDWKAITLVEWVPGGLGSTGVFFCDLPEGKVVVKTEGLRSAGEYFASLLSRRLGIATPRMDKLDGEAQMVLFRALRFSPFKNPLDKDRLKRSNNATYMAMEFVPGKTLPACALQVLASDHAARLLLEIGVMLVSDMVTNNFDRLPLCWRNEGNPENIMVAGPEDSPFAVSIDQCVVPIRNEEGAARYVESVKAALAEIRAGNVEGPCTKRVAQSVAMTTGMELDAAALAELHAGVLEGCKRLRALVAESPNLLQDLKTTTEEAFFQNPTVATSGLDSIDVQFMSRALDLLVEQP